MIKQNILITTDCTIFCQTEHGVKILLVQRKSDPYKNMWALPGGFLEEDEELEDGARRELHEETGLQIEKLTQLKAFGAVGRDPRGRTITVAFSGKTKTEEEVRGGDDAAAAKWFRLDDLPELAFDHAIIINYSIAHFSI